MVFTLKPFRENEEIYPKPSYKMNNNHINVWNLLRVSSEWTYITLFSMVFAFVPRKNTDFRSPHPTRLWSERFLSLNSISWFNGSQATEEEAEEEEEEEDDDEEDEEEDREEEGNRAKRRKA